MRVIEGDEVRQCSHVCVREGCEVIRNLCSKLVQQRFGLVAVGSEYIPGIDVNDCRAEAFHYAQRIFCKCDSQFVARNAATVVAVIEKAHIASDYSTVECIRIEKLRVVIGKLMA